MPIDLAALSLLVAAHSAPVLAAMALGRRWSRPLDGGLVLADGEALLGHHKTWRGLAAGTLAAALVGALLPAGALAGAGFGLLALLADSATSFAKRRLRLRPGAQAPLLDQLPESLLPLLAFRHSLALTAADIVGTAITFVALDALGTHLARRA